MLEHSATNTRAMQRLLLLRHGEVASHRGDVPVTGDGLALATQVGRRLAAREAELRLLSGETMRARQTAEAIADGARAAGCKVTGPNTCFAMRNPDLYVAGERVNLVSSADALAAQVAGFTPELADEVPFFHDFFRAPDRIAYWLHQPTPPGEDAAAVAQRVSNFAASLADRQGGEWMTVAVTHSPVLRACALQLIGEDPGEPQWLAGLMINIFPDRSLRLVMISEAP